MSDIENVKKLSLLVADQLPAFVRDDHETFVALIEAYYEFMEQDGGAIERGRNLIEAQDIDQTFPEFLEHFYSNFIPLFPKEALGDRTLFTKHARKFYRAKGTEKSFKLLFRLLFDEPVTVRYPKLNILIASGGKWAIEQSLRVIPTDVTLVGDPTGYKIIGVESNATAVVQRYKSFTYFGNIVYEMFIGNIVGNFISSEQFIAETTLDTGVVVTAFSGILDGTVSSIQIVTPGTGYSVGDAIPMSGGGGVGATGRITQVSTGEVTDFSITSGGSGYQAAQSLIITPQVSDTQGQGARAVTSAINTTTRQHVSTLYLNTDILGISANVLFNAATYVANLTGTINVSANGTVIVGTTGKNAPNTSFLTQLGPNVPLMISGNIAYVTVVANNQYAVVDRPFQNTAISNANVQVSLAWQSANVNTTFSNALTFSVAYGPIGPIQTIVVQDPGTGYVHAPIANVNPTQNITVLAFGNANISSTLVSYVRGLGIVGAVGINSGGTGYAVDDELVFTVPYTSTARNAGGYVSNVAANGAINTIVIDHGRLLGRANVSSISNVVTGQNSSSFNTEVQVGDHVSVYGEERIVINVANATFIRVNSAFSANNSNARIALFRDMPGGLGYSINSPPTITVTSLAGANANLALLSTLASGENLQPTTNAGAIQAVQVTNPGTRYRTNATADMTSSGDGNANLAPTVVAGIFNYTGYYIDSSSFLSSSSKLEDRDYYQNFSYVLRSRIPLDRYQSVLKQLLHPAGMIQFSEVMLDSETPEHQVTGQANQAIAIGYTFYGSNTLTGASLVRTSIGTYLGSNINVSTAAANTARYQYFSNGTIRGLLVEPTGINAVQLSANLANGASWNYVGRSISSTANVTTAPDGTNTAASIKSFPGTMMYAAANTVTGNSTSDTVSGYFKANNCNIVVLVHTTGDAAANRWIATVFDLSAQTVLQTANGTASGNVTNTSIEVISNGWFRLAMTGNVTGGSTARYWGAGPGVNTAINTFGSNFGAPSGVANGQSFFFWGPQQEIGAANVSSYIATPTTTAVTRSADVLTVNVANGTYTVMISRDGSGQYISNQTVTTGNYVVQSNTFPLRAVFFAPTT